MFIKPIDAPLHVVAVISNPVRYKRRYELYKHFEQMVLDAGAELTLVESALGERHHECLHEDPRVRRVLLRTEHELWTKENMINIGVSKLPSDWKYVAWIDADISFARPDWVPETLHMLQHHPIVQMFSEAYDLGPDYQIIEKHMGFGYAYIHNKPKAFNSRDPYAFWHPGFAWACTRRAWDHLGGLLDGTFGAADHHMACALIGDVDSSMHGLAPAAYKKWVHIWQDRAVRHLRYDLGYVEGVAMHYWHGKKKHRGYKERWQILIDNQYDPFVDIKKDWQGLYQLAADKPRLRNEMRAYFRARHEDSIDLE